jgi:uncharacterized protein (DUF2267 family)
MTRSTRGFDNFRRAEQTAHEWLAAVRDRLGTEDLHYSYRVLRAWLHTVRDRLPVDVAVQFAAQLPVVWRGLFYEGWLPHQVPVKYDVEQFLVTMAQETGLSIEQAREASATVTAVLGELTSDELVTHVLDQLPAELRAVLRATEPPGARPAVEARPVDPVEARLVRLERQLDVMADALRALVEAGDQPPTQPGRPEWFPVAARRAHQVLLTGSAG